MAKPPHTHAAMRVLYPVCQVAELAAGYRNTTVWIKKLTPLVTICPAAFGTLPRVADAAVGSATLGTGGMRGWADQVQRLITDEACDLRGIAPFTGWWLEFAGQGVPVHGD